MRGLLTTQSQNCYREQIQKEMLTRLSWKSRYARLYPSCSGSQQHSHAHNAQLPPLSSEPGTVLPPVSRTPGNHPAPPPPHPPPPQHPPSPAPPLPSVHPSEGPALCTAPPLMRPVSPRTRKALYQDSSHQVKGRRLYLQRRGERRPEEKFDFPLLSSWEYGWRLGDYPLDYKTPCCAKSSVVKNTFYARNGVFNVPSATDTLG
ncbi:uncharacterized protein LOC142887293 [Nelusetta ayraudi]|uniref:uncharacterized protein LOC142887293 n=1 Tax=Nelusetta ayraudi TaxID=303726 RepID=UPI003F6E6CB0